MKRSVAPGSEYGRVGEFLAAAARGMAEGNPGEAAGQLGEAAAELRRLMEQLGDATSLMMAFTARNCGKATEPPTAPCTPST